MALGGKRDGNFFEPTVLIDISPQNQAAKGEFFGPVRHVYRVGSEEEEAAVAAANDTPYGLGAHLCTTDPEQMQRVAARIEADMVYWPPRAGRAGADWSGPRWTGPVHVVTNRRLSRLSR